MHQFFASVCKTAMQVANVAAECITGRQNPFLFLKKYTAGQLRAINVCLMPSLTAAGQSSARCFKQIWKVGKVGKVVKVGKVGR
jgi:hypothetical protein